LLELLRSSRILIFVRSGPNYFVFLFCSFFVHFICLHFSDFPFFPRQFPGIWCLAHGDTCRHLCGLTMTADLDSRLGRLDRCLTRFHR
jgi:hypothetical protein